MGSATTCVRRAGGGVTTGERSASCRRTTSVRARASAATSSGPGEQPGIDDAVRRAARDQPVQEPHPPLRVGQRLRRVRSGRAGPGCRRGARRGWRRLESRGEARDGGLLEDGAQRQVRPQPPRASWPRRGSRAASGRRARRSCRGCPRAHAEHVATRWRRGAPRSASAGRSSAVVLERRAARGGQRPAVQLAARGQRQGGKDTRPARRRRAPCQWAQLRGRRFTVPVGAGCRAHRVVVE